MCYRFCWDAISSQDFQGTVCYESIRCFQTTSCLVCTSTASLRCAQDFGSQQPSNPILILLQTPNKSLEKQTDQSGNDPCPNHGGQHMGTANKHRRPSYNLCKEESPSVLIAIETFLDATVPDEGDCISIPACRVGLAHLAFWQMPEGLPWFGLLHPTLFC